MGSMQDSEPVVHRGENIRDLGVLKHNDHIEIVSNKTNKVIARGSMEGWAWNSTTERAENPDKIRLRVFSRGRYTEKDYLISDHMIVYRTP